MASKLKRQKFLDPAKLPGTFASRVFLGGSYKAVASSARLAPRQLLGELRKVVIKANLHPIIADEYLVAEPESEIHHDAIFLLHSCRLAIFELTEFSGALMEIERSADFGTHCLVLHHDPDHSGWRLSRMLSSFVQEHRDRIRLYGYTSDDEARNAARNWLDERLRFGHGHI